MIDSLSTYSNFANASPSPQAPAALQTPASQAKGKDEAKETFQQFVGETFFSQLIQSMRTSVDKAPYFHGGQAEEIFQKQLDQKFSEHMAEASAEQIAEPMYELFTLQRK